MNSWQIWFVIGISFGGLLIQISGTQQSVLEISEETKLKLSEIGITDFSEHAEVQRVLKAASTFQKAEVLVKRGDWEQAKEAARQAAEGDPDQAEYEGLYCWLLARDINSSDSSDYLPIIDRLVKAVKRQPNNVGVRLYRARVLKIAGMVNESMRDFKAVVEAQPHQVEAQRELRLHRMRIGSGESEAVGLLGRLFKKP